MTIPAEPVEIPERVRMLAGGAALTPVWLNGIHGLTFRADDVNGIRFIKWGPRNLETTMRDEAEKLRWARHWTHVPEVLEQGEDESHEWLVTTAIDGLSAVAPPWIDRPNIAVPAVGKALRELHDRLPIEECPWEWSVDFRINNAIQRGMAVAPELHTAPPIDRLVVCHGDACVPNTLLDAQGRGIAHVDFAALGVADRWADIAVAAMSTEWNYGPGWEDSLIEAYGLAPDRERIAYYQELWNAM